MRVDTERRPRKNNGCETTPISFPLVMRLKLYPWSWRRKDLNLLWRKYCCKTLISLAGLWILKLSPPGHHETMCACPDRSASSSMLCNRKGNCVDRSWSDWVMPCCLSAISRDEGSFPLLIGVLLFVLLFFRWPGSKTSGAITFGAAFDDSLSEAIAAAPTFTLTKLVVVVAVLVVVLLFPELAAWIMCSATALVMGSASQYKRCNSSLVPFPLFGFGFVTPGEASALLSSPESNPVSTFTSTQAA
mmetsp:Transcript_3443/g.7503  ORF Transcript_3443/g.7503 Transcript_3443/m.7503 type:complete len:246 (-) Transcript_3443:35-772(-)